MGNRTGESRAEVRGRECRRVRGQGAVVEYNYRPPGRTEYEYEERFLRGCLLRVGCCVLALDLSSNCGQEP
jgi:hypothetical protein